ncbi:MAG TPA: M14 family zinc carboxypeptidase [Patescibacteria group bacterium]|nr:M14 family zinc carboxypeptidase [Patescibacteria group bacterium]
MKAAALTVLAAIILGLIHPAGLFAGGERPTALVRSVLTRDLTQRDIVSRNIDLLAVYPDGRVDLAVTDEQLEWLRSTASPVAVLERAGFTAPGALDENLGSYHTYDEMEAALDSLAGEHPALAHIDTLGFSWEGRVIRAIKISDNAAADEDETEILIVGCHHAREIMSVEVPLMLAGYLLEHYGSSPRIAQLVDEREIWIVPMLNPDGHVYVQNNHSGDWWTWWRKNRRDNGNGTFGVDINRNYSYMWGYDDAGSSPDPASALYRGPASFSEPETQAMRDFCASRSFTLALSYHSYSELILFPWGYAPLYTDDHEMLVALGDSLKRGNDYTSGNTAMGAIYRTNGDSDDWAYGETGGKNRFYCFTVELNSYEEGGFGPPESLIQPTFEKVLELNLTLLGRADAPHGVLGPFAPTMYGIPATPTPTFKLHWSDPDQNDPNPPAAYEVVELKNLTGVTDSCEVGDTLWVLDGFSLSSTLSAAGTHSFYSGMGNNIYNTMTMASIYPLGTGDTVTCRVWYDIETDWDYAYFEASTDQGVIWMTVPGNLTTTVDPHGNNRGHGITGNSSGWVDAEFYLDDLGVIWENAILLLRFSYVTDDYVEEAGIYIDLVEPTAAYEKCTVIASALTGTYCYRTPEETGEFAYFVRAVDGEAHWSRRSNLVFRTVDDLTPAVQPPAGTALSQNYPNPFNPVTTIRFTVGTDALNGSGLATVFLAVYDCTGRRVAVLENVHRPPGPYEVRWEGRNDAGRALASGVYFTRLTVGGRSWTRTLILLR